jgi:hypothetical protein
MKIKFLKPVQGFAYFENEIAADLSDDAAATLILQGFAIIIPDTEGNENNLPEDLPAREILFNEGLETIEDVLNALPTIGDISGVSKKDAKKLLTYFSTIK